MSSSLSIIFFLSILTISLSAQIQTQTQTQTDVHDLLPEYGFPRGLIPDAVKSYTLSSNGDFQINLHRPCYVHFDQLVWYDKKIKGKLNYGSVKSVSGIQAKKLFIWIPVTGIEADSDSGMIEFWVGALYQKLPANQFEKIPECKKKGCHVDDDDVAVQDLPIQSI